jgi:hypothetical protein
MKDVIRRLAKGHECGAGVWKEGQPGAVEKRSRRNPAVTAEECCRKRSVGSRATAIDDLRLCSRGQYEHADQCKDSSHILPLNLEVSRY